MNKDTVVLIHGAWLTPAGWDFFKERYESKGYRVIAPPWPLMNRPIEQLRSAPHPDFGSLGIRKILDHYDAQIRPMTEPPIIMGHSTGGLIVQLLLDRGLGCAGVALDPVPIRGVLARPRVIRTALPVYSKFLFWNRVHTMSFESFATTFAQTLPESEKRAAYDRYVCPTPGRIYLEGLVGIGNGISPGNPRRAPLLICEGGKDLVMDPSTVHAAYVKQSHAPSLTEYKVFPGRSHFLFHEPRWEEVADFAIDWASTNARRQVSSQAAAA